MCSTTRVQRSRNIFPVQKKETNKRTHYITIIIIIIIIKMEKGDRVCVRVCARVRKESEENYYYTYMYYRV